MSDEERAGVGDDEPFDPDKRELCPDGMCTGVIGPDGRCKVCGRPGGSGAAPGASPEAARAAAPPAVDAPPAPAEEWRPRTVPGAAAGPGASHPDFARERVPCGDDMCTGIIGRDGRCGTCDKPWAGAH